MMMMMMLVDRKNVFQTILCVTLLSLCFDGGGGVTLERIQSDSSGGSGVYHSTDTAGALCLFTHDCVYLRHSVTMK